MAVDVGPYLQSLIGQPWQRQGLHCWTLVERVQGELFGRSVPLGPTVVPRRDDRRQLFSVDETALGWHEVAVPEHGAVARMHRQGGDPAEAEHAGVYLAVQGGRILHSDRPHGVVLDSLVELNVRGWVPRFYVPDEQP